MTDLLAKPLPWASPAEAAAIGRYEYDVLEGAGGIAGTDWNEVVLAGGGSMFHLHEWLRAYELAPPGRFRAAHILARAGSEIVGVCPAYLVDECPRLDYLFAEAGTRPLEPRGPILLAHSLAALAGGPVVRPGHERALAGFGPALARVASDLGAWAHGMVNLPGSSRMVGHAMTQGFAVGRLSTRYLLQRGWDSVEEYWAGMPSQRRHGLRRSHRKGLARGARVTVTARPCDDAIGLVHQLLERHDTPVDVLPAPFLRAVGDLMAPYARSVVVEDPDGRPISLGLGWVVNDEWTLWIAGLDVGSLAEYESYHLLLNGAVEELIATGPARVNLGRSNDEIKRRYGCVREPLFLALRAHDRRDTALLHRWCADVEQRHLATLAGSASRTRCC